MDTSQYFYDSNSKSSPLGMTLKTTGRYPIESWKQWTTLSDLKKFIINTDNDAAAYPGMVVSVVSDADDSNNGVYLVKKVGDKAKDSNGDCLDIAYNKLASISQITENEEVIAAALNDLNKRINAITTPQEIKMLNENGEVATTVSADGSTYVLKQGNDKIAEFNIVKDSFVKKGELIYKQSDGTYGDNVTDEPYIHLIINVFDFDYDEFAGSDAMPTPTDDIYIPVKGLITYGSFGTSTTPMVDGIARVSDVQSIIKDDEEVTAAALNNLNDRLTDVQYYKSNAGDNWKTSAVGGIEANKTKSDFEGKTVNEMLDAILYPTLSPTKTDPSVTIKYNGSLSTLFEVGTTTPKTSDFSVTTNRGSLSYVNSNGDYYYGGTFGTPSYTINGTSGTGGVTSVYGNYIYKVSVSCSAGATPLNNKGEVDASVAAYTGGTFTSSKTFTALYPIYINTSSISTMTKQTLKDYYNNSSIGYYVTIPAEVINGDKFMVELPEGLTLSSVKQKNMTNNQYDIDITMVSNGTTTYSGKTYNKYIRTKTATDAVGQAYYYIVIKKS